MEEFFMIEFNHSVKTPIRIQLPVRASALQTKALQPAQRVHQLAAYQLPCYE